MKTDINRALFFKVCYDSTVKKHERFNIGTYKEKQLHIILKHYFEPDSNYHEVPYQGFIADIKRENRITEIETSGFSGLSEKLDAFLPECSVNLVYPIPHIRYIAWIDPVSGDISQKRRSPKKPGVYEALFEMVRIRRHIPNPNLTVTAMLLNVDEYRMLDGWSRDRKKGSNRYERIPTDICEIFEFKTDADYLSCIPETCGDAFTVPEFSKEAHITARTAYAVIRVFEERGIVERNGKKGRANLYRKVTEQAKESGLSSDAECCKTECEGISREND